MKWFFSKKQKMLSEDIIDLDKWIRSNFDFVSLRHRDKLGLKTHSILSKSVKMSPITHDRVSDYLKFLHDKFYTGELELFLPKSFDIVNKLIEDIQKEEKK